MNRLCLVLLVACGSAFGASHIVLFKQSEVTIGALEHNAYVSQLQVANKKSVSQLEAWLGGRGLRAKPSDLWLVRGATVDVEKTQAVMLAKEPWVQSVVEDRRRVLLKPQPGLVIANTLDELGEEPKSLWGLKRVGLEKIRAEFPMLDGSGIRVGVLDTGIQSRHPELKNKQVLFKDFIEGLNGPYDDHGHGTHVSGTISGNDVGIAPKATILFGKMLSAAGVGYDSQILRAMQWVFDPDGNPATEDHAQVVSCSWGGDLPTDGVYDIEDVAPYRLAIQAWIHGGVIPVFAAGNSGKSPNGLPGGIPEALAVGALDETDAIAEFSSRGPNLWKIGEAVLTFLKPDITAPGVRVTSAFPGNKYATWAGTSMATPHVSGIIALALQRNPKLRFADVKARILMTSEKKTDTQFGYGILDGYAFVKSAVE